MTLLVGARVLAPGAVLEPGWAELAGSRIAAVGEGAPPQAPDVEAAWLAPGFVDLHVHGGGGGSFVEGDVASARRAVAFHRAHGTTTTLASLVSAPPAELVAAIRSLRALVDEGMLAGVHLEGPFLAEARCGAHDARHLRAPAAGELEPLLAEPAVRMITLAPELDGGLDAVRRIAAAGVIAAVGHTDASYEVTHAAVDAGARIATHLGNAMRPLHQRDPGAALALLEDPRVAVELIADGAHLHPAVLRGAMAAAGVGRAVLVTDAIAAAGRPDGAYRLGGLEIDVRDGIARLAGSGALAGSTLTMDAAVRTAVEAGIPAPDALRAASETPARVLGADWTGALTAGRAADIVLLDEELRVAGVLARGERVQ
jgi:N-acetylglucosamine-6-phosphate deacetylase